VGNRQAMLGGIGTVVLLILLLPLVGPNIILLAPLAISSSFILNGTIPFALEMVPPHRGGLGIGMYFGGSGLAMSLFGSIFNKPQAISPQFAALMSAIAFCIVFGCVISSKFIHRKQKI
ncbi:MAG: MFS transporter, partial [Cyanobacteria bacterium J06632_19]